MNGRWTFSLTEVLRFSWNATRDKLALMVGVTLFLGALSFIVGFITSVISEQSPLLGGLIDVVTSIYFVVLSIGLYKIVLMVYDGQSPLFTELFKNYRLLLGFLIGGIAYGLIVAIGLIFFIIPGLYFAYKYFFYDWLIVDKELDPLEAFKKSAEITKGYKINLFIFSLGLLVLNVLGVLAFGVGLLVTIPMTLFAQVFVYKKLLANVEEPKPAAETPTTGRINPEEPSLL